MKILIVTPHFYPHVGGGEQALMDVAVEYVKKGHQVRVVTATDGIDKTFQNYNNIDIFYYDWFMMFGHPLPKKKDLVEHIKWADVVHSAVYSVVPATSKLCKKYNKPHVCTVHEVLRNKWYWIEPNFIKATMFRMYEKYTVLQHADLYVVPSTATLTDLKIANKKADVQRIFWISENEKKKFKSDKEKFNKYFGVKDSDKVFLNYGRPGKTKGVFIYLDAIKTVLKETDKKALKNIKFCFIMASDPASERKRFIEEIKKNNLENYVIVKESVSREDLDNYRSCADYIVVPSITEGFGLSAIEACEFKKKLICSTAGSLPEVTFGDVLHFENRNSRELADILEKVITNKIKFTKKEKKDFSKETITNEFIKAYKKVIKMHK